MEYSWDKLISKSGVELYKYYKDLLRLFDTYCTGRVREIYQGAMTNIDEPKNLEKIDRPYGKIPHGGICPQCRCV